MRMRLRARKYRLEGVEMRDEEVIFVDLEDGERIAQIDFRAGGMPEYGFNIRVWTERPESESV